MYLLMNTIAISVLKVSNIYYDLDVSNKCLVMRACEGCRRRKIKCDAATTNHWPCAACVRLKLHCVPPQVNYNRTHSSSTQISGLERVLDFDNSSGGSGDEEYSQPSAQQEPYHPTNGPEILNTSQASYNSGYESFHPQPYTEKSETRPVMGYDAVPSMHMPTAPVPFQRQSSFHMPNVHTVHMADSADAWASEQPSAANLSDVLGELKIDETGIGTHYYFGNIQDSY